MRKLGINSLIICTALACSTTATAPQFTSFAGFRLDNDIPLAKVQAELGASPLQETGDGGEYEASICYDTPTGIFRFLSSDMGGSEHTLLGFSVSERSSRKDMHCWVVATGKSLPELSIGGLVLGMTRDQFSALLGSEVAWESDVARRVFLSKRPMTANELKRFRSSSTDIKEPLFFDVSVTVIGTFRADRLVQYEVWKITSL